MAENSSADKQSPKPKAKKKGLTYDGPKPRHRSTNAELNREKITAQIITLVAVGRSIEEIANELDVTQNWVRRVRDQLPEEFTAELIQAKTNVISGLIEELIREQLLSMIRTVKVNEDELWLKAQRAPELATFFGVINDKTVRILAAIERADERARFEREDLHAPTPVVQATGIPRPKTIATQGS